MRSGPAQEPRADTAEGEEARNARTQHRSGARSIVLPVTFGAGATGLASETISRARRDEPQPAPEPPGGTMIAMPPTPDGLYVTGLTVFALRHPSIGMGFNWRVDLRAAPGTVAHRSDHPALERGAAATARAIGNAEIADLRPALRKVGHGDGKRSEPVWGATHVRATLELAWQKLEAIVEGRSGTKLRDTYDTRTMRVWLGPVERARAVTLGDAMAHAAPGGEVDEWNEWLLSLTR